MAKQIASLSDRRVGGPAKYPWDRWLNGHAWRIRRGEDFDVEPQSMSSLIRKHADRQGKRATVHVFDDGRVEFQACERERAAA
jgi:hypothetical protein